MSTTSDVRTPVQESDPAAPGPNVAELGFYATTDLDEVTEETNWEMLSEKEYRAIRDLSLSDCKLSELPKEILLLTNLTRLYLTYNSLSDLPADFKILENLRILNLGFNLFKHVPGVVFHLNQLQVLYLKNNQLTSDKIDGRIVQLTKLEELYLGNNLLETFPQSICNMCNLLLLTLSSNKIKDIPESIKKMQKLNVLIMRSNRLKYVPQDIGDLHSLEAACFAQNMITTFPFGQVKHLSKLRDLCLHGNRLSDLNLLRKCQHQLAKRGGMFRAEENRVVLHIAGGVCDGAFRSWSYDIMWIYDGEKLVETWIKSVIESLDSGYHLSSKVFECTNTTDITNYSVFSRVVCVVCTEKMGTHLRDQNGETGKPVKQVLVDNDTAVIPVMYDEYQLIPQMIFNLHNRNGSVIRRQNEDNVFCEELVEHIRQIGHRLGPNAAALSPRSRPF